jgi:hypothetical protein
MKKIFLIVLVLFILYKITLCQNQTNIKSFNWLVGIWSLNSKTEKSFEEWKFISDTLLKGRSYTVNQKDTIISEIISIVKTSEGIFYKAEVFNQNNGDAVYFKLTNVLGKSLIFENKTHDFPKTISYKLHNKRNLTATIEGDTIKYEFKMIKIK